jgi:hypothetical protein
MEALLGSIYSRLAELYENRQVRLTAGTRQKLKTLILRDEQVPTPDSSSSPELSALSPSTELHALGGLMRMLDE